MSVSTPGLLQHCLAASVMSQLIQEWHVKDCTDPDFAVYTVVCGSYITCSLPATYVGGLAPGINHFQEKCRELGTMINHVLLLLHLILYFNFLSLLIP